MKQTTSRAVRDGTKYIQQNYAYLLERGYEIVAVEDAFLGWQITLRRADLFVRVEHTRGEDYVSFHTATQPAEEWTELGSVVYAATGEMIPYSGDDGPALQKYFRRIERYFDGPYLHDPEGLRAAQAAYRETLPKAEPVVPPTAEPAAREETKKIAILYYPLMGIILLLIFGALTTLYAVLLNSLLAAFSLNSDSSLPFVGAGAVLLAIGTMFLLRKWVKLIG